jgi:hypothetical protein
LNPATKFNEIIEEDGNRLEMQGEITEYIKNKVISFHLESKIHKFDVKYSLEDRGQSVILSIEAIIKWKFPMNIVSLFIGRKMKEGLIKQIDSEVIELKRICEDL